MHHLDLFNNKTYHYTSAANMYTYPPASPDMCYTCPVLCFVSWLL